MKEREEGGDATGHVGFGGLGLGSWGACSLYPQGGGIWAEEAEPDSGAHWHPLVAAAGRTQHGGRGSEKGDRGGGDFTGPGGRGGGPTRWRQRRAEKWVDSGKICQRSH